MKPTEILISPQALFTQRSNPEFRVIDATWFLPPTTRDAYAEFTTRHIPGAVFFDIDKIADKTVDLPHMLPTAAIFAQAVGKLGINNHHTVVVYDTHGIFSAPRVWWTFKVFGHQDVRVLDGGLPAWLSEGLPVVSGRANPVPETYHPNFQSSYLKEAKDLREALGQPSSQILDVRPAGRFAGEQPEPRPGLRSGHIPGSINLPWDQFLEDQKRHFLPPEVLHQCFEQAGIDFDNPVTCSCGSGITACLGAFGLYLAGHQAISVYDGSWAEWGANPDYPVVSA